MAGCAGLTVVDLKHILKTSGQRGYSKLNKAGLVRAIKDNDLEDKCDSTLARKERVKSKSSPKAKPTTKGRHPPFKTMVVTAITAFHAGRKGSSRQAIQKYFGANYRDLPPHWETLLKNTLKKMVESGELVPVKASYRLPPPSSKKTAKKSPARKTPKKSPAKESPARKTPARKPPARKTPKKSPAKKASSRKQYELVFYELGTSLYHEPGDGAVLRPRVKEVRKRKIVTLDKPPRNHRIIMIVDTKTLKSRSDAFTSLAETRRFAKEHNLKLGTDVILKEFVSDRAWTGHR